jgi:hypothetical protein
MWVTRKGTVRRSNALQPSAAQQEQVLQVSINGNTASLRGLDYTIMMRSGPPQEIEQATRQLINWERLIEALPEAIQIVEDGTEFLARLTFQECGSPPRDAPANSQRPGSSPSGPEASANAPSSLPLPQGAIR